MTFELRPPTHADAGAVLDVPVERWRAQSSAGNRGALALYRSAGMRPIWEWQRREKQIAAA